MAKRSSREVGRLGEPSLPRNDRGYGDILISRLVAPALLLPDLHPGETHETIPKATKHTMPVTIEYEPNNVYVMRVNGICKRSEFGAGQGAMAREIDAGSKPRILAILENFQGWEKGADWNDLDFLFAYGNQIAKIAIVGEPRWEVDALAFAGAGFRRAPVKFFAAGQEAQARAWLDEQA